ncbi:sigma-54-dependent Fis family transcriptional regulator, partial [Thioclava sp. BHET1]
TVHLPRLHDRRDDIAGLFLHLAQEAADRHGREVPPLAPAALADLAQRDWPGNIRELRNLAECHVLGLPVQGLDPSLPRRGRLAEQVDSFERTVIAGALGAAGGSLRTTYEILGVSRKTLYEKMQKHGLSRQDFLAGPRAAERVEDD